MSEQVRRFRASGMKDKKTGRTLAGLGHDAVLATDFDTLAQRLQEAERLLRRVIGYEHGPTLDAMIDAFLAGKDGAP